MQLLEHEAKAYARSARIPVPEGDIVSSAEEAASLASSLGGRVALKAQVPLSDRRSKGGIWLGRSQDAAQIAERMLISTIEGHRVATLLVERCIEPGRELFLGVTASPRHRSPALLVSGCGGSGIEKAFAGTGVVRPYPLSGGFDKNGFAEAAAEAGLAPVEAMSVAPIAAAVHCLFTELGAQTVELNPLVLNNSGAVAVDVRIVPDPALQATFDAPGPNFDFVVLDEQGDVGLLTTGAGASILLVDLLAEAGLRPANFCDMRTGSLRGDPWRIEVALERIAVLPRVRCIAVNVFAGITDLEEFATLFLGALTRKPSAVPIVCRLEGAGRDEARAQIAEFGHVCVDSLEELVEACRLRIGETAA